MVISLKIWAPLPWFSFPIHQKVQVRRSHLGSFNPKNGATAACYLCHLTTDLISSFWDKSVFLGKLTCIREPTVISLCKKFLGWLILISSIPRSNKNLGKMPLLVIFSGYFLLWGHCKKIFGYHPSGSSLRPLRLHSAQKTLGRLTRRLMANGWNMIRTYAVIKNVKNPPIISGFDGLENHLSASFPQLSLWVNPHNRQKFLGEDSMQPTPKSFFTKIILKYLKIISKSHFFPAKKYFFFLQKTAKTQSCSLSPELARRSSASSPPPRQQLSIFHGWNMMEPSNRFFSQRVGKLIEIDFWFKKIFQLFHQYLSMLSCLMGDWFFSYPLGFLNHGSMQCFCVY